MIETRYDKPRENFRVLHLNITNIETADTYQLDVTVKGFQKKVLSLMTPLGFDHASSSQMEELYQAPHSQSITVHVDWSVCNNKPRRCSSRG